MRSRNKYCLLFAAWAAAAVAFAEPAPPPAPAAGNTLEPITLSPAPASTVAPAPIAPALPPGASGPVQITSHLDKAIISVGDLITYTLEVEAPQGSQVLMPQPGAELGRFIIRDYQAPQQDTADGRVRQTFSYTITAYTTGTLEIPALPFAVKLPNNLAAGLLAEAVQVRVVPVSNPEDLEIKDVKPPVDIPIDWRPYYLYGGLAVAALAAFAALAWYFLRRSSRAEAVPEPVKPAHEVFAAELAALRAARLLEAGKVEDYYTRLSEIFRRYLALRWRIYALEYTSSEILERLRREAMEMRAYSRMKNLLEETDLVKFARHLPAATDSNAVADQAAEFVAWTREPDLLPMGEADAEPPVARASAAP